MWLIKLWMLSWGDHPGLSRWAWNAITNILTRGKQRAAVGGGAGAGRHTESSRRKWNLGGRDQSDAARKPVNAGSHSLQETRTSLKGTWSSQHLDFSPINLMLRFWSLELWQNTFLLFQAISFVVICYISHRQQIHRSKSASLQNSCSKPLMCTQPPSLKIQLL